MKNFCRYQIGWTVGALAALVLLAIPGTVAAQATATVRGVVFDSTAMAPLAGARVAVIGTNAMGETDGDGRFMLENIPPGSHWVSFFHDRLQELGVGPQSRQVTFAAGGSVDLALTIPTDETLLLGSCLAEQPAPGFSAIVTASPTGVPMPPAIVRAEPIGRSLGIPPIEVRTDDSGYFRRCSVRGDQDFRVQAKSGQSGGQSMEMYMEPGTALVQDLVPLSADGTLAGFVRDYISGEPVAGATVSVMGTTTGTVTDLNGRFIMHDLPSGRHLVTTDHVAFGARTDSVTVFSQETVDIEVPMATDALEVEGLAVTGRTRFGRPSLAGGSNRADFITREEIELVLPRVTATADLLRSMNNPGLRIRDVYRVDELTGVMIPGLCIEISRGSGGEGCVPAAVALNNVIVLFPDQLIRDMDPNIIDHIEILSPIDAQFQFGSVAGNGAIAIFTR